MNKKKRLFFEFSVLFVFIPIFLIPLNSFMGRVIIPALLLTSFFVFRVLKKDLDFDKKALWKGQLTRKEITRIFLRFIPGAILLGLFTYLCSPDLFLTFPRKVPQFWIMVMILYPLVSVYPQELIFRTFIFYRYKLLFQKKYAMIIASAAAFGLYHLFFCNWIAPVLSLAGGFLFAGTYARTRSTAAVVLEHALWGDLIFTIGLGMYFYGGNI
jgi:uncharacterized protein